MNPFLFGSRERSLFGVHTPPTAARRRLGVVLCPPLGLEYERSHRAQRQLADRLATNGHDTLRFDYFGTGDSAGGPEELRLAGCVADALTAVDELCALGGVRRVCLIGLRFGAVVAALAAAETRAAAEIVLWDPISDGRVYAAQLRDAGRTERDGLFVGGHLFTSALLEDIERIRPADLARSGLPALGVASEPSAEHDSLTGAFAAAGQMLSWSLMPNAPTWVEQAALGVGAIPVDILDHITNSVGAAR